MKKMKILNEKILLKKMLTLILTLVLEKMIVVSNHLIMVKMHKNLFLEVTLNQFWN